ncbi:MAG: DUF4307 domain-containing protein [Candidatus Nanopelagicales bacterium]|nr:DUF4307 domain-containing protein [Candidatus Nanopelagicales bacterium]
MPSPFTRDQLSPEMQARYGLDRRPVGVWISVGALIAAFVGILAFITVGVTGNPVEPRLVAWKVVAADRVDVTFSVNKPADASVYCVLRAQDENRIDLGYATVDVAPGKSNELITYPLRTLAPAFTVELLGCSVDGPPGVTPPQFPPGVVPPEQPWAQP